MDLKKPIDYNYLKGKNVLLTGGASGLGLGMVRMFAEAGAQIVVADIDNDAGKNIVNEINQKGQKAHFVQVDVSSWDSQVAMVGEALKFFSAPIDILVTSAGIGGGPMDTTPEHPDALKSAIPQKPQYSARTIQVNLIGTFFSTQLVLKFGMGLHDFDPSKIEERWSDKCIINIASAAAYSGVNKIAEYTASKFGVRGMWRVLRKQMEPSKVRMHIVAPFYVETPMTVNEVPVIKQAGIELAKVEQVVEAVARLATERSVSGRSIAVWHDRLQDLQDDSSGFQAGTAMDVLNGQYAPFVRGPLSDDVLL